MVLDTMEKKKKAGQANHEEQMGKQHSSMASASINCLQVPALISLDDGLQAVTMK